MFMVSQVFPKTWWHFEEVTRSIGMQGSVLAAVCLHFKTLTTVLSAVVPPGPLLSPPLTCG